MMREVLLAVVISAFTRALEVRVAGSIRASAAVDSSSTSLGDRTRPEFQLLDQSVWDEKPLVYLDSGATSQKPASVVRAMTEHLTRDNANVHLSLIHI